MKKQEQDNDNNNIRWLIIAGIAMTLISCTALWGGYYFHQFTQGTWMEIPEIITSFVLFSIGPFVFVATISALFHE